MKNRKICTYSVFINNPQPVAVDLLFFKSLLALHMIWNGRGL
jgi:hypothetical protein